ncbi:MAG: TonB-dependent receptor [Bryobacteraceae bacterium]
MGEKPQVCPAFISGLRWRPWLMAICMVLVCAMMCNQGLAQVNAGAIIGKVTDPSGAVVIGADVTVQNVNTGVKLAAKTNGVGDFAFRGLLPGVYGLTVSHPGFRTYTAKDLPVAVSETNTQNVALTVGEPTTSVTVEATAAPIDSSSSTLGTVVNEREVKDLPLNGRNFTQLLTLTTGVANIGTSGSWGNQQTGTFITPSINGQSEKSTVWLLDGTNNSSPGFSLISVAPVIDDIAEFKVDSHADSAEYGGALGGYVNVATKSGTNDLHGGLWEFLRNDKFDARNFFLPSVSPFKQNQFGGNLGGPVYIPKLYNGRNHTFFFFSYQGFRESQASSSLYRVPTPAEMGGNLSGEFPIFDPFSTRAGPGGTLIRDPFPGNIIPTDRLDPIAQAVVSKLYPAPVNTGFAGTNGINPTPNHTSQDMWTARGDEQIRSEQVSFRFTKMKTPNTTAGDGGIAGSTFTREPHGYNMGVNYTHTFSPTTIFHMLFGRSYVDLNLSSKWNGLDESSFVPQYYSPDFACGFVGGYGSKRCYVPALFISGFAYVNEFSARVGQTNMWEAKPDLTMIRGRHTFKLGADYSQNTLWAVTQRAFINYDGYQTADLNNPATTGSSLASFLLGVPSGATRADAPDSMSPQRVWGGFFQDQWKVNSKLTVNLGVRYDATIMSQYGNPGFFDYLHDPTIQIQYSGMMDLLRGRYLIPQVPPSCASAGHAPCIPTPDGSLPAHVERAPNGRIFQNVYDNVGPRIGIAYSITPRTVLRVGAGRYFDNWSEIVLASAQSEGTWPDSRNISTSLLNRTAVQVGSANPLALVSGLPTPTPFTWNGTGRDPYMKDPLSDQFNAGVEHQITGNTVLSVHYVGSRGRRIPTGSIWNTAVTPGPGDPTARQPYPYIVPAPVIKDWSRNWYDSLQVTLERKFTAGLVYKISYTWSKSEDLGSSDGFGGVAQDPYNLWLEKEVSNVNLPQVLSGGFVYEIPFGAGRRYQTNSKPLDAIIGGWQLNSLLQFTSGAPYGIIVCGDSANVGRSDCYLRPNLVGDPGISDPSPSGWFNKAAFAAPPQYTFGTLGNNPFRGQAFKNVDLSVFRDFRIKERARIQFRAEAFNAFNMVTFGNPNGNLSDAVNFGKIFGTRSTERQLQFALKFLF